MRRIAAALVLAAAVATATAGCGLANQATTALAAEAQALTAVGYSPDDVTPTGEPTTPADKPRKALRKTLHGEIVVQTKDGEKTILVQRGEVTQLDGNGITVESSDGFTLTWTFGDKLKVVERRTTVAATDALQVGDQVGVAGAKTDDGGTARLIVIPLHR